MPTKSGFPSYKQLFQGAILGTIAHAIWLSKECEPSYSQMWDGMNYVLDDNQGARGAITFAKDKLVGVFFDYNSIRSPWRSGHLSESRSYLRDCPKDLFSLAEREAMQYVLEDYNGDNIAIVTAAFWGDSDQLAGVEEWEIIEEHGGHLVHIQILPHEEAMLEWTEQYELLPQQSTLLMHLFRRRMDDPDGILRLSRSELDVLTSAGDEGLKYAKEMLSTINIVL
jgi:hypothetical protein